MSDTALPFFIRFDTTANRMGFTPDPGVPEQLYIWIDSDDQPNAYYWDGGAWVLLNASSTGDVVGPGSSTDEAIARFDGTSGKLLQNSVITISNTGVITLPDNIRQIFNPGANAAGINVGAVATDPDTLVDGDIWYNSGDDELNARINGSTVSLGSGGSGITELTGDVTAGPGSGSQAATIANDAVTTGKILNANVTYGKIQNVADGRLLGNFSGGAAAPSEYSLGAGLEQNSGAIRTKASIRTFNFGITVDGGASVVTTGAKGFRSVPVTGTITSARLLADAAGDVVFDVKKSTYAAFPTQSSIVASAPPTLSGVQKNEDTTLSGWTTAITAGDVFGFEITGTPATIKRVTLELTVLVTG